MRMTPPASFLSVFALTLASLSASATTYYVSSSTGSDSNSGLTPALAVKTIAKANTLTPSMVAGDQMLLKRGDVWHEDALVCGTAVAATASTTLANTPPVCSGAAGSQVYFGAYGTGNLPLIDGADPITATWTDQTGGVFKTALPGGKLMGKLYMDPLMYWHKGMAPQVQLFPAPNVIDTAYNAATAYKFLDMSGGYAIHGGMTPTTGVALTGASLSGQTWGSAQPSFDSTINTGPQNVAQVPGSWYTDGTSLWVHLIDGSSPAGHVLEATYRNYCFINYSNYVEVQGIACARQQKAGIEGVAYASSTAGGSYFTGEYNTYDGNTIWNYGDLVYDSFTLQGGASDLEAGIIVRPGKDSNAHLQRGNLVSNNHIGTMDAGLGGRQRDQTAGIFMVGQDGGGAANNPEMLHNYVATTNAMGAVYGPTNASVAAIIPGGEIAYNEFTKNQGNLFVTYVSYINVHGNYIHETSGQGVQNGGNTVAAAANSVLYHHNLIAHLDDSISTIQFNGFDCNGNATGVSYFANTVVDTNSDSITHEIGCPGSTMRNNIFDQNHTAYPAYATTNNSYMLYYQAVSHDGTQEADHNLWIPGSNSVMAKLASSTNWTCAQYLAGWPDTNSTCGTTAGYTNYAAADFSITSSSAAYHTGDAGQNMGAFDGTANSFSMALVGPQTTASAVVDTVTHFLGQMLGQLM